MSSAPPAQHACSCSVSGSGQQSSVGTSAAVASRASSEDAMDTSSDSDYEPDLSSDDDDTDSIYSDSADEAETAAQEQNDADEEMGDADRVRRVTPTGDRCPPLGNAMYAIQRAFESVTAPRHSNEKAFFHRKDAFLHRLLKLLQCSDDLIQGKVLQNTFNMAIGYGQMMYDDRTGMMAHNLRGPDLGTVLEGALEMWNDDLMRLDNRLFKRWTQEYHHHYNFEEWNGRLLGLWERLDQVRLRIRKVGPAWLLAHKKCLQTITENICEIFVGLHDLVADADYVLVGEADYPVRLPGLIDMPSRHEIIAGTLALAPGGGSLGLKQSVEALVNAMDEDTRSCTICLSVEWDSAEFRDELDRLHTETERSGAKQWLRMDQTQDNERCSFTIRPGFESVPLKMGCGHVFCAGCAATFLRTPEGYRCPFRDGDYGIARPWDMDTLVERLVRF